MKSTPQKIHVLQLFLELVLPLVSLEGCLESDKLNPNTFHIPLAQYLLYKEEGGI